MPHSGAEETHLPRGEIMGYTVPFASIRTQAEQEWPNNYGMRLLHVRHAIGDYLEWTGQSHAEADEVRTGRVTITEESEAAPAPKAPPKAFYAKTKAPRVAPKAVPAASTGVSHLLDLLQKWFDNVMLKWKNGSF